MVTMYVINTVCKEAKLGDLHIMLMMKIAHIKNHVGKLITVISKE